MPNKWPSQQKEGFTARCAALMVAPQVGTRWPEYSAQEQAQLASLAFDMLTRGAEPITMQLAQSG